MSATSGKKGPFAVILRSDVEYEYLFAAIEYNGVEVACVTQEDGKGKFKLEASFGEPVKQGIAWVVDLDGFLEAVEIAKKRLLERA